MYPLFYNNNNNTTKLLLLPHFHAISVFHRFILQRRRRKISYTISLFFSLCLHRIECTKFNVQFPDKVNEIFTKVENEFKKQSEQWEVYENFMAEYDEVGGEEWAVYRRRPYLLTDFLSKWESKLATTSVTISSVRIQNLISRIRNNLPNITLLQSDALVDRHWAKIIQLLCMTSKSYHEVKLKELLNVIDGLEQNASEIQNIVRQATSEQIVRQAITELEQWGVTATLKTTIHTDSKGIPLTLVKEFQDVLNKVINL